MVKTKTKKEDIVSEAIESKVEDTFLGIKTKNIFIAFVGLFFINYILFVYLNHYSLTLLLAFYTFPIWFAIKKFSFKSITLKSTLIALWNWFAWTVIYVLFLYFWSSVHYDLYWFYNTVLLPCCQNCRTQSHYTCGLYVSSTENIESIFTLIITILFVFTYFCKKSRKYKPQNEKGFLSVIFAKTPRFIKTIFCFVLSVVICSAVLMPLQYTVHQLLCKNHTFIQQHNCSPTYKFLR